MTPVETAFTEVISMQVPVTKYIIEDQIWVFDLYLRVLLLKIFTASIFNEKWSTVSHELERLELGFVPLWDIFYEEDCD